MDDHTFIADRIAALRASVEYFSAKNKTARELWVAERFLQSLRIRFQAQELGVPQSDPPDVIFRDAKFEIKEILDTDRPRHKEFKDALAKALMAKSAQELIENYSPKFTSPSDLAQISIARLDELSTKYPPAVRKSLDLLLYINLRDCYFKQGPMPPPGLFSKYGWRSISGFENSFGLVLFTDSAAPNFLKRRRSKYSSRNRATVQNDA